MRKPRVWNYSLFWRQRLIHKIDLIVRYEVLGLYSPGFEFLKGDPNWPKGVKFNNGQ